jgi:DNA-binding helix-hairpin-helix protein with protein kinase domain
MTFVTSSGRRITLSRILGRGAEGIIYGVDEDAAVAAKIYTDGEASSRLPKLRAMIDDRLYEHTSLMAFPIETVSEDGRFAGFTMRKVANSKPLFQLYIPVDRKTEFPDANFRFIVHTALNLAKAVANVHSLGAVIGDLNESGALVNDKGYVTLVDSDSIQYTSGRKIYRCTKGKAEYTPPELQGQRFDSVNRTTNHDAFSLAVLLFQILFLGRHPFSGIPLTANHPTIAEAIKAGRFAYSSRKSITLMEPPPHMPVLTDIPPDVAAAFERGFGPQRSDGRGNRPSAADWVPLFERMENDIIECQINPTHYYSRAASTCPWCRFEAFYAIALFVGYYSTIDSFNLEYIAEKVNSIGNPGSSPDLGAMVAHLATTKIKPSPEVIEIKAKAFGRKAGGLAIVGLTIILMFNGIVPAFFLLIPAGILLFGGEASKRNDIYLKKKEAEQRWQESIMHWNRQAGAGAFEERRRQFDQAVILYRSLPDLERQKLADLERTKRELQLRKHLESHKLASASIDNIGDSRKMTLRSFGIETAWDITEDIAVTVPGFGPALTGKLMDWRQFVESLFRFNSRIPTDPAEITRVKAEILMRRNTMQTEFVRVVRELESLKADILAKRRSVLQYQPAFIALKQAEADWNFLN